MLAVALLLLTACPQSNGSAERPADGESAPSVASPDRSREAGEQPASVPQQPDLPGLATNEAIQAPERGPSDEELQSAFDACNRQMAAAKSRDDFERADRTCQAAHEMSAPNDEALASNGNLELVEIAELRAWWPYRPLLLAPAPERGRVLFGAWSKTGGTAGNSSEPHSTAIVFYEGESASVERHGMEEFLDAGGLVLTAYSPATAYESLPFGGEPRTVHVRGAAGTIRTTNHQQSERTYRRLSWREPASGGDGAISYDLVSSGETYSDTAAIGWANALRR